MHINNISNHLKKYIPLSCQLAQFKALTSVKDSRKVNICSLKSPLWLLSM